jgi:hypothetical protein
MHQFQKHYTLEEAREMLPSVRLWLDRLAELRDELARFEKRMEGLLVPGADLGGRFVNDWVRATASTREVLIEFHSRDLQLKDIERGLVDFPAIIGGREVFLCWEKSDPDIEHWHDLDSGYAGREPIA